MMFIRDLFTRVRSPYILPLFSALLLGTTLPWIGFSSFVFVALVPLFFFLSHTPAIQRARGLAIFGLSYGFMVVTPIMDLDGTWWSVGPASFGLGGIWGELIFLSAIVLVGLWGSIFFLPIALLSPRNMNWLWWGTLPLMWSTLEYIRTAFGLFGYSWGVVGYPLAESAYFREALSLPGGVFMLSFLVIVINLLFLRGIVFFLVKRAEHTAIREKYFDPIFFSLLAIAILVPLVGHAVRSFDVGDTCARRSVMVSVIASALATEKSIDQSAYNYYRDRLLEALEGNSELVVLPENALPFFEILEEEHVINPKGPLYSEALASNYVDFLSLSAQYPDSTIAIGLHTIAEERRYNSIVFYRDGTIVAMYHKRKLVPFAEFSPLWTNLPIVEVFSRGERDQTTSVGNLNIQGLICSEIADPTIRVVGADVIVSPSNDSVFTSRAFTDMQHFFARVRAMESGAYLLRASKGGVSSIIAPNGKVVEENRGEGILSATIPVGCESSSR